MSRPLSPDSPRKLAAARFGAELRKAMTARKIGTRTLGPQAQCSRSGIAQYRLGVNLPTIEVATRLAHALDWPSLVTLAKNGRQSECVACGRKLVTEGGRPRRYCSSECAWVATKKAAGRKSPGVVLAEAVGAELARVREWGGAVKRTALSEAVATFHADAMKGRRVIDLAERKSENRQGAIDAMCAECEPEGMCKTPECPLRAFSLLPLSKRALIVDQATPAEGVHGPTHKAKWLAAIRAGNARRWTPEERAAASEQMRQYHIEHPEHADLTREGVRRRDQRRREAS